VIRLPVEVVGKKCTVFVSLLPDSRGSTRSCLGGDEYGDPLQVSYSFSDRRAAVVGQFSKKITDHYDRRWTTERAGARPENREGYSNLSGNAVTVGKFLT
jgi:hypothetical protein